MNFLLDGLLLAIVITTIVIYYNRGFVKAVLGFGKTLLSFICAAIFGPVLGGVLASRFFDGKLTETVYNTLYNLCAEGGALDISRLAESLPESLRMLATQCGADVDSIIASGAGSADVEARLAEIAQGIALPISAVISKLVGYVLVFIAAYLILLLVSFILEGVAELPVIRVFNHLLGLLLGFVCAIIFAFIFIFVARAVLYYVIAAGDPNQAADIVESTVLFKYFCRVGGIKMW